MDEHQPTLEDKVTPKLESKTRSKGTLPLITPYHLIPTTAHDNFIESVDAANYEKSIQTQLKSAWASFGSLFSSDENSNAKRVVTKPIHPGISEMSHAAVGDNSKKIDLNYLVHVYSHLLAATNMQHGVTIKTMTQVKEIAEYDEARNIFCSFLDDQLIKHPKQPFLKDYAFFPLKEMLLEILTVAMDKKDFKSAFMIIYCTQRIELKPNEGESSQECKLLSEYYYPQAVVRMKPFWGSAIQYYRMVRVI